MKRQFNQTADGSGAARRKTDPDLLLYIKRSNRDTYSDLVRNHVFYCPIDYKNLLFNALSIVSDHQPHSCHMRIQ